MVRCKHECRAHEVPTLGIARVLTEFAHLDTGVARLAAELDDEVSLSLRVERPHRHVRVEATADDGVPEEALEACDDLVEALDAGRRDA